MSKAPPARSASLETVATTSPVVSRLRTAGPVRAAWCATTWISRYDASSQLSTATRCRMTPATAWITPRASSAATQQPERRVVAVGEPVVDRLAEHVGHQRLRDHPDDPEQRRRRRACRAGGARPRAVTAPASACRAGPDRRREARSSARSLRVLSACHDGANADPLRARAYTLPRTPPSLRPHSPQGHPRAPTDTLSRSAGTAGCRLRAEMCVRSS